MPNCYQIVPGSRLERFGRLNQIASAGRIARLPYELLSVRYSRNAGASRSLSFKTRVMNTTIHKQRRPFDDPVAAPKPHPRFIPPPYTNLQNLSLPLNAIDAALEKRVQSAGKIVFHALGDSGGVYGPEAQEAVAHAMEAQFTGKSDSPAPDDPAFFYHLGDVIYFNGETALYPTQFYEPYQYYPANIFAIPGNHDGDTHVQKGDPPDEEPSLTGFVTNFCDSQRRYLSPYRPTMTQPYVYWTLETPLATIIGLYSNVDGLLDGRGAVEQAKWLQNQLDAAPDDRCLLIAVHHPPYSLDSAHGGYAEIGDAIDRAIQASRTNRYPDIVLSGHVHNYQRFTRTLGKRAIPYVVAGGGGYANKPSRMHRLQKDLATGEQPTTGHATADATVVFEAFNEKDAGFLRITIDKHTLVGEYFIVPFDGSAVSPGDRFTLDWHHHTVKTG